MSLGAVVDLAVTLALMALIGAIGYLLKGRFDDQDAALSRLTDTAGRLDREVTRLTEAQKSVVANQMQQSHTIEHLINDSDDLADKVDQLDNATGRLREQLARHVNYLRTLHPEMPDLG